MAGKGQTPKRKPAAKPAGQSGKPAATPRATSEAKSSSTDRAQAAAGLDDTPARPGVADDSPRPERHPLARMREETFVRTNPVGDGRQSGAIRHVSDLATRSYDSGHDTGAALVESVLDRIRLRPLKSLLIAVGLGFLYGLTRRR